MPNAEIESEGRIWKPLLETFRKNPRSMYRPKRILAPYDGLPMTEEAVRFAKQLAFHLEAKLYLHRVVLNSTLESVMGELDVDLDGARKYCESRYKRNFSRFESFDPVGVKFESSLGYASNVSRGVIDFCKRKGIDIVVVRRSYTTGKPGANLVNDLKERKISEVLIYKNSFAPDFREIKILIPLDSRRSSLASVCRGVDLAGVFKCIECGFDRHAQYYEKRGHIHYAQSNRRPLSGRYGPG